MKKFSTSRNALLTALLFTGLSAAAQQAPPVWQQVQRLGMATASLTASATDAAGNSYVVGSFFGTAQFGNFTFTSAGSTSGDGYLLKLNAQGTVLWARQITGPREEAPAAVALDATGNVTLTGTLQQTATFDAGTTLSGATAGSPDLFVARYDASTGALQWARSFGGNAENVDTFVGSGVAVDAAGNSYVAGCLLGAATVGSTTLANAAPRLAPVLLKLDAAGTTVWARQGQLATTGTAGPGGAAALSADAAGNVTLCGTFSGSLSWNGPALQAPNGRAEVFVARFDSNGTPVWAVQSSNSTNARPNAVGVDAAGNAYLVGNYEGSTSFGAVALPASVQTDGYLLKISPNGVAQWAHRLGGSSDTDQAQALAVTPAGATYVTGSFVGPMALAAGTNLAGYGASDIFVACYGPQGTLYWAQQAGSTNPDRSFTIGVDGAGAVHVTGQCAAQATFAPLTLATLGYPFIAKLEARPLVTAVGRVVNTLSFSPNPATETVRLAALPAGTRLMLIDAVGRTVRNVQATAGETQVPVRDLAPGAYLLRATDATGQQYGGRLLIQ